MWQTFSLFDSRFSILDEVSDGKTVYAVYWAMGRSAAGSARAEGE